MKVVAIVGSYRNGGITDQAVEAILAGAVSEGAETGIIRLREQPIEFCANCRSCTQTPGDELGTCVLDDKMAGFLATCSQADVLVVAAPVNMGTITAVMKRFMERLIPTADWPWGRPAPRRRRWIPKGRIAAVLVSSCAAPSILARLNGSLGLRDLKQVANAFNARVFATRNYGMVAMRARPSLGASDLRDAETLGRKVVRDQRTRRGA